jgi:hypothetical protein
MLIIDQNGGHDGAAAPESDHLVGRFVDEAAGAVVALVMQESKKR